MKQTFKYNLRNKLILNKILQWHYYSRTNDIFSGNIADPMKLLKIL